MDSELLSVFNDEHYEATFNKYEDNYWPISNCENFVSHLSENLNGILPISPLEEKLCYFENDIQVDNPIESKKEENIHFSDYSQHYIFGDSSETGATIEIVSVDPNADFVDDNESSEYENDNKCESDAESFVDETFRSRTDSSSIGDYESHTSDESDLDHDDETNFRNKNFLKDKNDLTNIQNLSNCEKKNNSISHIDFVGSSVMVATNNLNESIEIDTENFDLATFITEDNFISEKLSKYFSMPDNGNSVNNVDDESEEIVDIETIDDSSSKKHLSLANTSPLNNANSFKNCSPNTSNEHDKNQNNFVKQKYNIKISTGKSDDNQNNFEEFKIISNDSPKKEKIKSKVNIGGKNISMFKNVIKVLKDNDISSKELKCEDTSLLNVKIKKKEISEIKKLEIIETKDETYNLPYKENLTSNKNITSYSVPPKKKLNLEEYYKKRKSENKHGIQNFTNKVISPIKEMANSSQLSKNINNTQIKQSLLVPISSKPEDLLKAKLDPITEAKNKVLRMQEIKKKEAQKRLIDITVLSKVGPVTKILPLEEIVKSSQKHTLTTNSKNLNNSSEYEEIIIVSVSCNTDIKISPNYKGSPESNNSALLLYNISSTIEKVTSNDNLKISNNSLITSIKSVVLQKTVKDVMPNEKKLVANENGIYMDNKNIDESKFGINNEHEEHGEDKIIMHLPKNRIKKKSCNVSTQTDPLPEFSELKLVLPLTKTSRNRRNYKNRKYRSVKTDKCSSSWSDSSSESDSQYYNKRKAERFRSHSRSTCGSRHISPSDSFHYNNFETKSQHLNSTEKERDRSRRKQQQKDFRNRHFSGSGNSTSSSCRSRSSSYSDRSLSRSRSKSNERNVRSKTNYYQNYKKLKNKNTRRDNSPAVEERRIVYVGRIEAETTKDDLKRKFIAYGPIKQITLHYKDTGMKYGFVTFEKADDAFKAIDSGASDLNINMYDISFGGRRAFCRQSYADLDGAATNTFQLYSYGSFANSRSSTLSTKTVDDSFESLLKKMKEKLNASKCSTQKT